MAYPLIIEPEAELDLQQAVAWYNDQQAGLGRKFLRSVEEVFERIRETPELHGVAYRNVRQTLVKRFPFVVCYVFEEQNIHILAVFHGHRDPSSWKLRVH